MNNKGRQINDSLLNISAPKLSNYYEPSEDQKISEYMFGAGGGAGALIVYFYNRAQKINSLANIIVSCEMSNNIKKMLLKILLKLFQLQ